MSRLNLRLDPEGRPRFDNAPGLVPFEENDGFIGDMRQLPIKPTIFVRFLRLARKLFSNRNRTESFDNGITETYPPPPPSATNPFLPK